MFQLVHFHRSIYSLLVFRWKTSCLQSIHHRNSGIRAANHICRFIFLLRIKNIFWTDLYKSVLHQRNVSSSFVFIHQCYSSIGRVCECRGFREGIGYLGIHNGLHIFFRTVWLPLRSIRIHVGCYHIGLVCKVQSIPK